MGNKSTTDRLQDVADRAASRVGKVAVSGRYKKLPKRLEDDYIVDAKVLGTGYNGSVFLATSRKTSHKFAVKGFHLHGVGADKMKQLEDEAEIFLGMDHPHVARLVDVYESETHLNLVMECMEGGELFERLAKRKRFSEQDAARALWQMLLAVNYIHSRGVVHRDLKLENFLYEREDSDHLKLIDFGFSHIWEPNKKMMLSCGTLAYVAPEVLKRSYTSQCDLWSLGVILFILLAGYMPFSGPEKTQRRAIETGTYSWREDRWKNVSPEAIALVKGLLDKEPTSRLTAEQAMEHRWLLDNKDKALEGHAPKQVDQDAVDALCDFAKASQFRKACMSVMAWSLTNEERAKVRDMFLAMDKNKQGTITLQELKNVLTTEFHLKDEDARGIFDALDTAQTEEIHYSEFLAAMVSTRIAMHDDLMWDTFQRFDCDKSGFITAENLREVLGESFSGAEVNKLLQEADLTKDGKISYEEFIQYLKSEDACESTLSAVHTIIDNELKKPGARKPQNALHVARQKTEALAALTRKNVVTPVTSAACSLASGAIEAVRRHSKEAQGQNTTAVAPEPQEESKEPPAPEKKKKSKSRACSIL